MSITPIPISRNTPKFIREIADSMFGNREFLPLQTFIRRMGMDRKTVFKIVGDGLLDVFQYQSNKYRKIVIPKTSFIRFLKATSLRKIN